MLASLPLHLLPNRNAFSGETHHQRPSRRSIVVRMQSKNLLPSRSHIGPTRGISRLALCICRCVSGFSEPDLLVHFFLVCGLVLSTWLACRPLSLPSAAGVEDERMRCTADRRWRISGRRMRSFLHLLQRLQQQLKRSQKYGRYQLDALQLAGCVPVILFLELVLVPSRAKKMGAAKSRDYRFSDIFLLPSCSRELLAPLLFLFFFYLFPPPFFSPGRP